MYQGIAMEHGDVIDIDELLGVSSPQQSSLPLEEYNLDDFLDTAFHEGENGKSGKQCNAGKTWYHGHKSKRGCPGQNAADQTKSPPYQQDDATEAFLDSLLATIKPSGEGNDLTLDINSDELRRFIAEYQIHDGEVVSRGPQIGVRQTEDGASVSSSASESLDSSSLSGEGGVGSKVKNNKKMMRGMRFLVANLLRSKTAAMASPSLGSEDERQKEVRRQKLKDKSKRREEKAYVNPNSGSSQNDVLFNHAPPTALKDSTKLADLTAACCGGEKNKGNVHCNDRMEAYATGMTEEAAKVFQVAVEADKLHLERYLRSNPSLRDSRDGHGNVLLHILCRYGKLESMQWLASGLCGHHVSLENNNCFTPTAIAVKYGRLDCVEWLINETKAKDELHSQDNRWSLLHIASRYGQEPCLRWLLQFMQNAGIHLDVLDRHSNSSSHLAARHGHLTCLQTLVEFNCDVTMVNGKKHTPCSLATKYNHNTCAQFLVVTETCISLSDQVTRLRRDLREYHQEKVQLKARLDDAIQCSEALVRMHPRDTTQRIEQIQQQYVDLTNLLVRRIDDMHQKKERDAAHRGSSCAESTDEWGEEIALCKQRANELQDSCSQLLEEEHARQESNQEGELSRIQETLQKLQQQDGSSDCAGQKHHLEDQKLEPLKDMRKRLHKVSLIRSASPSVMNRPLSDRQDSVSLSSSYTSLSSSSSSLSMVSNGPHVTSKPTLQKQVSWEDQCHNRGALSIMSGGSGQSDAHTASLGVRNMEQEDLTSKVKRHLNELISGKSSTKSQSDTTNCQSSHSNQYYSSQQCERDDKKPTNHSMTDGVLSCRIGRSMSSTGSNMNGSLVKQEQVKQSLDALMKSALPDLINSGDAKRGQVSPPSDNNLSPSSEDLSHSWHGGCNEQGRNRPLNGRLRISSASDSTAKSSMNVRHARHSSENSPLSLKLASLRNQDDEILHRPVRPVTSSRSTIMSGPVFMRKLQSTGHVPGGEVSVHVDHFSHDLDGDTNGDSFHPRLNSDSSLSSATSSDVVWSDIDHQDAPDTGPMYKRRAGILNRTRRTGEGNRKSRNRHIKFALDEENCPSSPASDASYRHRDLSPIYESESHRQQREKQAAEFDSPLSNTSSCNYNPPVLGHREYRVNFYSSDDDDYETESPPPPDSPSITGSTSSLSQSHLGDGTPQDSGLDHHEEADKFWYESSEEDEGSALSASIGSTSERHICYL